MTNEQTHPTGVSSLFDYIKEANVTASNNFHGHAVAHAEAFGIITSATMALNQLDKLKKALFYGRDLESFGTGNEVRVSMNQWPNLVDPDDAKKGELILHAIVGIATESGELLEALLKVTDRYSEQRLDEVNLVEELGDVLWYIAIALGAVGVSFEEVQRRNIAKLRHRFPEKFTEFDANNRDLFGERKILEMQDSRNLDDSAAMSAANEPKWPESSNLATLNRAASRGLRIEISGPAACGKGLAENMLKDLIPTATVVVVDKPQ